MKTIFFISVLFTASSCSFATSVTLTNFKAVYTDQKQIDLTWLTMMESGVDHYEIQRSGDGLHFAVEDSISSKMKSTTSEYQLQYTCTDTHPLSGISYYRIRVIGRDGSTTLSPVVQTTNNTISGTRIYPTLIQNNMVFVETDRKLNEARVEIYDLNGHKISETNWQTLDGRQTAAISRSGYLPAGTYVIRLTAAGQNIKNQMVIIASGQL